jgi:hypothetical protein
MAKDAHHNSICIIAAAPAQRDELLQRTQRLAFPINDAICEDECLRFISSCNELNAAYAAMAMPASRERQRLTRLTAGRTKRPGRCGRPYAEQLPIFHLTGQLRRATQRERAVVHHTLGNGEFDLFCVGDTRKACALYYPRRTSMGPSFFSLDDGCWPRWRRIA